MNTDHVIAATGYKVDIGRLAFLDPALRSRIKDFHGAPVLDRAFQSSVRNLHFVGISSAFSFGPVMRFVHGTKHAAAILHGAPSRRSGQALRTAVRWQRSPLTSAGPIFCRSDGAAPPELKSMIRKSGNRFSDTSCSTEKKPERNRFSLK